MTRKNLEAYTKRGLEVNLKKKKGENKKNLAVGISQVQDLEIEGQKVRLCFSLNV
jgi:hypothetical protein